jgi:hypothetical protein
MEVVRITITTDSDTYDRIAQWLDAIVTEFDLTVRIDRPDG